MKVRACKFASCETKCCEFASSLTSSANEFLHFEDSESKSCYKLDHPDCRVETDKIMCTLGCTLKSLSAASSSSHRQRIVLNLNFIYQQISGSGRCYSSRTRTGRTVNDSKSKGSQSQSPPQPESEDRDEKKTRRFKGDRGGFIDSLRIHVKGGPGGQGLPSKGGVGGRGGDVIVEGKKSMKLKKVLDACPAKRFSGGKGGDAAFFCAIGEPGPPTTVEVPLGISIVSELGTKMGDINEEGDKIVVAKGGDGGQPNNGFCGMKGHAQSITLDLKLIADVGFVGYPNAGKSTLLKAISRAKPKIASYPFTTLRPNIGIVEFQDFRRISLADLPGLIEGAHMNSGLGYKFLKHVERTKMLLFVVDIHGFQLGPKYKRQTALETIITLNRELELYLSDLTEKPAMLALNKMDLPDSYPIIESIREIYKSKESVEDFVRTMPAEYRPQQLIMFQEIMPISAKTSSESVNNLRETIRRLLDVNEDIKREEIEAQIRAMQQ